MATLHKPNTRKIRKVVNLVLLNNRRVGSPFANADIVENLALKNHQFNCGFLWHVCCQPHFIEHARSACCYAANET